MSKTHFDNPVVDDPGGRAQSPVRGRPMTRQHLELSRRWRRITLVIHIVSAGAWIGIDVMVAILVLVGWFGSDLELRSLAYRALATFVIWPMFTAGLTCLLSGLLLGIVTKWGLLRYWWVVMKLAANLILCTLIPVLLQPGMDDLSAYGQALLAGHPNNSTVVTLFFPPAVSMTTLVAATVLAVVKPWGRTGQYRRKHGQQQPHGKRQGVAS